MSRHQNAGPNHKKRPNKVIGSDRDLMVEDAADKLKLHLRSHDEHT